MTTFTRRKLLATLALGAAPLLSGPVLAHGDSYPSRPIHIVVPYSAGGVVDTLARIIGSKLSADYGEPVIVENKSGAGGSIGDAYVAKSAPDGYTVMLASPGLAVEPSLIKSLDWNPVKDFRAIEGFGVVPNVFVVLPSFPAKSMAELIAIAKSSSTPLSFASAGIGTTNHLSGELLAQMAGLKLTHVPYPGQSAAINDLLAGRVTMMPLTVALADSYIKAGKLRPLAVTTAHRSALLPNVPTVAEAANLPGYDVSTWFGLVAPAKTPDAVVQKLSTDVAKILALPDVKAKLVALGMDLVPQNPKQFDTLIATEYTKWGQVIKKAGIQPQ